MGVSKTAEDSIDIVAFDIGGTQGRCALARMTPTPGLGTSAAQARFNFEKISVLRRLNGDGGSAWMARLISSAKELCSDNPSFAAISFGGPVSPDGAVQSTHVPGWENVDLIGVIANAFGLPRDRVCVENDANAGALGESRYGAGRGCCDMLYFTVSTGIGGGVILGGKLRRGAHGMAGEFGHMIMEGDPGAPRYAAGKPGALEALASGPAIEREGRAAWLRAGHGAIETLSTKTVFEAAEAGEAWAVDTRKRCVAQLGRGIAAAVSSYDVARVVVGGGVSLAGDALFVPLRDAVELYLPKFMAGKVTVVPAALGDQAPLYGAVAACMDRLN